MPYKLKVLLFSMTHPSFWLKNHPQSYYTDRLINELMDKKIKFKRSKHGHTVFFGNIEVWATNYPYAFGYIKNNYPERLPYAITRKRLWKYIDDPSNEV